jgi:hypothetical protein
MTKTVQAKFDGQAFYPEESMPIAPNTRVLLTVVSPETVEEKSEEPQEESADAAPVLGEPYSFLKFAMSLNLDGPEDWSENLEGYLYGDKDFPDAPLHLS